MRTGCVLVAGNLAPCRLACSLEPQVPGSQATSTFGPRKVSKSGRARLVTSVSGSHPNHKIFIFLFAKRKRKRLCFCPLGGRLVIETGLVGVLFEKERRGRGAIFSRVPVMVGTEVYEVPL